MKILLLAGEESGMIYADALEKRLSGHEVRGFADYGFSTADLAVFGFGAVLRKIFFFMRVMRTMKRAIDEWRPDVVCTVDYPGMNLRLAAHAKSRGIRAVHVVCPQVWAWKSGRIPKIEAALDALCCFFPFEPGLFRPGFAHFVGHPLAVELAGAAAAADEAAKKPGLVALLPGSRRGEIERNLPPLLDAARLVDGASFAIPAANEAVWNAISRIVAGRPAGERERISVQRGGARRVLAEAECAAVASGTATLEAALIGCPTVLVYRVSAILAWILRRMIKGTKYVGLANIVWDRCGRNGGAQPMQELLQEDFTPEAVASALRAWLGSPSERAATKARLAEAVGALRCGDDPMARIAAIVARQPTAPS